MSKHTPGPWKFVAETSFDGGVELRHRSIDMRTERSGIGSNFPSSTKEGAEADANYRLIAVAPEMLLALCDAHDHLIAFSPAQKSDGLIRHIRQLIKKVEGE